MDPKDFQKLAEDINVFDTQDLDHIKMRPDILGEIRFDVTPSMIMEPCTDHEKRIALAGYMFYIEAYDDPPLLMLMKIGKTGVMTTAGRITEVPAEMMTRAVEKPVEARCDNMYAITDEIREWLEKELFP